jgi:hypothetical protein
MARRSRTSPLYLGRITRTQLDRAAEAPKPTTGEDETAEQETH